MAFPSLWLAQVGTTWRPDVASLLIGLLLGALLATAFYRVLPRLMQLRDQSWSRVRETQLWVRAGVEKRFQSETATYVQHYHLGHRWATLEQIFISPSLLAAPAEVQLQAPPGIAGRHLHYLWPELATRVALPPVPALTVRRLLLTGRRVILSAPPGAGKTTLLAYCAHLCANATDEGPYTFLLPILPIFVHLAELDLDTAEATENPAAPLAAALHRRAGPLTAPGIGRLVQQKLEAGHALLLLDGWDEIRPEKFPFAWLRSLLARYPDNRAIIAAPLHHYGPLLEIEFVVSGLLPWRASQAAALRDAWASALELSPSLQLHHFWEPGHTPLRTTFALWRQPGFPARDGATTGRLSDNSLGRYEPVLQAWLALEERDPPVVRDVLRMVWEELACKLITGEKLTLSRSEVDTLIGQALVAQKADLRLQSLVWRKLRHSPLFVHWPNDTISFRTPLLRDYLAASYFAARGLHDHIVDHLHDPLWVDVVRFYIGRVGEAGLAEWMLDPRSTDPLRDQLFQVAGWMSETESVGEWRRQTLIQLGQLIVKPGVPQILRQRAVAAISLTGEPGILALLRQLMQRTEPALRQAAAMAMANQRVELAVPVLEKLLEDGDTSVRIMAIYALAWLSDPATEKLLLMALIDRDPALSEAVAAALALNGDEGWQVLREAAEYEAPAVRRAAVHGLSLLDEYWAVELLEHITLEDSEGFIRVAASTALDEIAARNRPDPWLPRQAGELRWLVDWAARRQEVIPAGPAALPFLLDLLERGPLPELRRAAAHSLAQVYLPPDQRPHVHARLKQSWMDGDPSVGSAAFMAWATLERAYARPESET